MNRTITLGLFAVVALAQIAAPAWMIIQREIVLERGTAYKFRTAPVDPYDPFRGRYVLLAFENTTAPYTGEGVVPYNTEVFAVIEVGEDGFATFSGADMKRPASGDYLRARAYYLDEDGMVQLDLPFDRYYMNEKAAPAAEIAVREHSTRETRDAYVTVRVMNGRAVLEQLYVNDVPIEEFIRTQPDTP